MTFRNVSRDQDERDQRSTTEYPFQVNLDFLCERPHLSQTGLDTVDEIVRETPPILAYLLLGKLSNSVNRLHLVSCCGSGVFSTAIEFVHPHFFR